MAGVLRRIHEGLDKADPALCASLVQRVRRTIDEYLSYDLKHYGPDSKAPLEVCARKHGGCPYTEFARSGKGVAAEDARSRELRKCRGPCGLAFHEECFKSEAWDDVKSKEHWPEAGTECWCGCAEEPLLDEGEGGSTDEGGASTDEEGGAPPPSTTELDTMLNQKAFVTRKRVLPPGGASSAWGRH